MKITYRPEIDGLRAIAVVAVILYHAQISILGNQIFEGGFIGVDIFFVISGYLITSIILKEIIEKGDILIENKSRNTYENAKYTSELLSDNTENLLLITSSWHMKRADLCFRKFNLNCDKFPTDYTTKDKQFDLGYLFLPNSLSYEKWETLIKEWVGFVVYKIKF